MRRAGTVPAAGARAPVGAVRLRCDPRGGSSAPIPPGTRSQRPLRVVFAPSVPHSMRNRRSKFSNQNRLWVRRPPAAFFSCSCGLDLTSGDYPGSRAHRVRSLSWLGGNLAVGKRVRFAILRGLKNGGRSSMVESQIVILVVAGSSPVGHPISPRDGGARWEKRGAAGSGEHMRPACWFWRPAKTNFQIAANRRRSCLLTARLSESSSRRDAETNTRDGCAPRNIRAASSLEGEISCLYGVSTTKERVAPRTR